VGHPGGRRCRRARRSTACRAARCAACAGARCTSRRAVGGRASTVRQASHRPTTRARRCWTAGRRAADTRHLVASTDLCGDSDWPGLAPVVRLERPWREHGQTTRARHDGSTSLPPAAADARRLLDLKRGHWSIENRLHRTKDVALGEDASLVHRGVGPTVMALRRDTAVSLLHRAGCRTIASRRRAHADTPLAAAALVVGPPVPPGAYALRREVPGATRSRTVLYAPRSITTDCIADGAGGHHGRRGTGDRSRRAYLHEPSTFAATTRDVSACCGCGDRPIRA